MIKKVDKSGKIFSINFITYGVKYFGKKINPRFRGLLIYMV